MQGFTAVLTTAVLQGFAQECRKQGTVFLQGAAGVLIAALFCTRSLQNKRCALQGSCLFVSRDRWRVSVLLCVSSRESAGVAGIQNSFVCVYRVCRSFLGTGVAGLFVQVFSQMCVSNRLQVLDEQVLTCVS